jgi:hypothetical protein
VIVTTFPRPVRVIEHTLIPLKDGTKLAARIWLPDDAEQNPVPAILEYLPYRKRDGTYERDALTHPYLAGHGYAGVRVDIRGCGESNGLLFDEYAKQEQDDGVVASHPSKSCRHRQADIGLTSPQRSLATIGVARIGAIFQVR